MGWWPWSCCFPTAAKDNGPTRLKVVVVGDGDCGKTCLLRCFSNNKFLSHHVPTVFDVQSRTIYHNHQQIELILHDTAGEEDYDRLRHFSYRHTDVLLLCFAVDNPHSLHHVLLHWLPEVRHYCPNVPILLIATKKDTRSTDPHLYYPTGEETEEDVAVSSPCCRTLVAYEEGLAVARKVNAVGYYETSAKAGEGVGTVFEAAVQAALEDRLRKSTGLFRYRDSASA